MDDHVTNVAADADVRVRPIPLPRGHRPPGADSTNGMSTSGSSTNGSSANGSTGTDRVDETAVRLDALDDRVRRLERLLTSPPSEEAESWEPVEPELVELAAAAEYAESLARMLVTPAVRAACERAIDAWAQWQAEFERARETAVAASRTIAITASDQDGHLGAVRAFDDARAELAQLRATRRQYLNTANHARAQLDHDAEVRERYRRDIDAGQRAWTTLTARLQLRTAAAVERAEPLPAWLVVSLGPPPPISARWVELAAQLFAYRITYAVDDPVEALGPEPTVDDSPRRRQWHRELEYRLVGWRDSG